MKSKYDPCKCDGKCRHFYANLALARVIYDLKNEYAIDVMSLLRVVAARSEELDKAAQS